VQLCMNPSQRIAELGAVPPPIHEGKPIMKGKTLCLTIALSMAAGVASAAPWTYRGILNDGGKPANGSYDLRVSLLSETMDVSITRPLTLYNVAVENGHFAVDVDFGIDLANAPVMRLKAEVQQGASGFVALGVPTRFDAKAALGSVCWDLSGNAGTDPANDFIGTTDAQPLVLRTQSARSLRIEPSVLQFNGAPITANIIAGSRDNDVSFAARGSTIAGGGLPLGDSDPDFTNEGPNRVTDAFGTVGGGMNNQAGDDAPGPIARAFATVSGGTGNRATGRQSVIGGGAENTASAPSSSVGGGSLNEATGRSATVSGGELNCAGGNYSWAGGFRAKIRPGNDPGDGTCVADTGDFDGDEGTFVWADDQDTDFISTGSNQFLVRATGGFGLNTNTIPAGSDMVLQSRATSGSGIVDLYMRTEEHGRGINLAMLPGTGAGQFRIAQYDGTTFTDRILLRSNGDFEVTAQAFKPGGGAWAVSSDARLKIDVVPLTGALDRLLQLVPVEYSYSNPNPAKRPAGRHIGFIAQDVAKVFPAWVATDDDGYLTVAAQGFEALTVESLRELQRQNALLQASLDALEARLAALESGR
jgi:hypothetical protein